MDTPQAQTDRDARPSHHRTLRQRLCIGLAALALVCGSAILIVSCCRIRTRIPPVPPMPQAPKAIAEPAVVRVVLRKSAEVTAAAPGAGTWRAVGPGGAELAAGEGPWHVGAADGVLTLDGRPLAAPDAELHPHNRLFRLGDRTYRGYLAVSAAGDVVKAVNVIEPELYLKSVVGSEMYASWPMDALMAQAVTARTYMLYVYRAQGYLAPRDMAYKGVSGEARDPSLAVELTRALVLTYRDDLFCAYFHSTCGGHTVAAARAFGEEAIPPLSGVPCDWCRRSSAYSWRVVMRAEQVARALKAMGIDAVRSIAPSGVGPEGYARFVLVNGASQLDAYDFRLALGAGELKSTQFTVAKQGDAFVFEGRGYGHGVGLCQWGACGMAREGHDWQRILKYYYPGVEIRQIDGRITGQAAQ